MHRHHPVRRVIFALIFLTGIAITLNIIEFLSWISIAIASVLVGYIIGRSHQSWITAARFLRDINRDTKVIELPPENISHQQDDNCPIPRIQCIGQCVWPNCLSESDQQKLADEI
jgi:hypothetical protein